MVVLNWMDAMGGLTRKARECVVFFLSLPTYSLSLFLAGMGVKRVGARMFWSNICLALVLMVALLKFSMHTFNCPGRGDHIDLRSEATWGISAHPRRRMAEGVQLEPPLDERLEGHPTMTVFCAPKAFDMNNTDDPQRRALLSWLRLRPRPKIVLLGQEPTMVEIANEFPAGWISVEAQLDYNMKGMPMFHSMMARARAADTNISMMINGDIVLLEDFMVALRKTMVTFDDWMMTAMRWDLKQLPYRFQHRGWGLVELIKTSTGEVVSDAEVAAYGRAQGTLHTYGGVDFWAWNVRKVGKGEDLPLHTTPMPPFTFGRGRYDNWLTHQMVEEAGPRAVIDASDAIVNIHVAHTYAHVGTGGATAPENFWSSNKKNSWETFANIHLSQTVGSFKNQQGTALHIPYKMLSCAEPSYGNICLTRRLKPASCTCEYSSHVNNTQTEPRLEGVPGSAQGRLRCGSVSVEAPFVVRATSSPEGVPGVPGLPHTLQQLLPDVADADRTVVLVAVTSLYKEFMLNFVCRARQVGVDNVLIAALDEGMYRYAFTQGLPVYYENTPGVARVKTRAVLRTLRLGYHVLWSDVDVMFLKNPLPLLAGTPAATLAILSNEPNASMPANGLRRINSGFYYARAEQPTLRALEAVVDYAAVNTLSDQLALNHVLCGVKGEHRVGEDACVPPALAPLHVSFLDRRRFPNGAVHGLWDAANATTASERLGAVVLHNNWVLGKADKIDRLVRNQMWSYDTLARMCVHDWHPWHTVRRDSFDDYKATVLQVLTSTGALREYSHP